MATSIILHFELYILIFLYGSDSYRLNKEAELIIEKYRQKHSSGVNFFSFDLLDHSIEDLENAIKTVSFFNEVKLIAVKNIFTKKDAGRIAEIIKRYHLLNIKEVVLLAKEYSQEKDLMVKNKELFKILTSGSLVRSFDNLEDKKLEDWICAEFKARECSISPVAVRKLAEATGHNSSRLACEIDKLSNYRLKGEISSQDIDKLVNKDTEPNIFHLLDAMAFGNKSKALELMYVELKNGRDPYYILTMIIYQFRNLIMVKDLKQNGYSESEISQRTKLHPFVVKKAIKSHFSPNDSLKTYQSLLALDTGFKSGKIDFGDSLYSLVIDPIAR